MPDYLNTTTASIPMESALFSVKRAVFPTQPRLDDGTIAAQIQWQVYYEQLEAWEQCPFIVVVHVDRATITQVGKDAAQILKLRGWVKECPRCVRLAIPSSSAATYCEDCEQELSDIAGQASEIAAERRNEEVLYGPSSFIVAQA